MKDAIYEIERQKLPEERAWNSATTIYGLARVATAATDSALNIDLKKSGYLETFEAIARLADERRDALGEVEEKLAGSCTLPLGTPNGQVRLLGKLKALSAQKMQLVYANGGDDPETAEFASLSAEEEMLRQQIANAAPKSNADAAAMLEWIGLDGQDIGVRDEHRVAREHVIAYLKAA